MGRASLQDHRRGGGYEAQSRSHGQADIKVSARRWTIKDPIRFRGHQVNVYVYVGDDPVNGMDPRGTDEGWVTCEELRLATTAACAAVREEAESARLAARIVGVHRRVHSGAATTDSPPRISSSSIPPDETRSSQPGTGSWPARIAAITPPSIRRSLPVMKPASGPSR